MALDLVALTTRAVRTATGVGVTGPVTITRPAPAPNPLTGVASGSSVSQTADAVAGSPRKFGRRGDSRWAQASQGLFIAAGALTFAPAIGHVCQFGGSTFRVVAVDDYNPTGATLGYFVGLAL
ncbi:MAG: hypothetical protein K2R93_12345 [Gemmatimonadaceae bacterium]|nr:hypothetical protein [Gemmatimonadaceae bacterium]